MTQIHRRTEALQASRPDSLNNAQEDFGALKWGPQQTKNTPVSLQTKQSKKPTREESLPGRTRNWLERSVGNAKDEDVLCVPFLTGAKASYSLLAQGASFHSGFTAPRPYIEISTTFLFATFGKAQDTFLFRNSDGGRLLGVPCSFHWILLYIEVFPYCESYGPEEKQAPMSDISEDYFNTTILQTTLNACTHPLLSKLFDCQSTEFFKLVEREGASRSVSLQASRGGACLGRALQPFPVTFHCSHWSFQTNALGGETERWFCTLNFLIQLV